MTDNFLNIVSNVSGLSDESLLTVLISFVILVSICYILFVVAKGIVMPKVRGFISFLNPTLSSAVEMPLLKFTNRLAWLLPCVFCLVSINWFLPESVLDNGGLYKGLNIYLYFNVSLVLTSLLSIVSVIYNQQSYAKHIPIKGILQIIKLAVFIVFVVLSVSELMDATPLYVLSSLGALTAVLLLIFKDTILGLVAGVQIATHRLVGHGDWIEMKKFGADGEVLEVGLHTVKVRNWDKTLTSIPTTALVHDSFKNWRGMIESDGRRIKRAILVDIHYVTSIDEQKKANLIGQLDGAFADFCQQQMTETAKSNVTTNIGLFRQYCHFYLTQHPMVNQEMTLMARQLPPNEFGIGVEVYCFCLDKNWVTYETVQAQIIEQLVALLPVFELQAYQRPSNHKIDDTLD